MFKSSDPALNAAMLVMAIIAGIVLLVAGAVIIIPAAIIGGIGYLIYNAQEHKKYGAASTAQLVANATPLQGAPPEDEYLHGFIRDLLIELDNRITDSLVITIHDAVETLYQAECLTDRLPPAPPPNTIEEAQYRDMLIARAAKLAALPQIMKLLTTTVSDSFAAFTRQLPALAQTYSENHDHPTVPLIDIIGTKTPHVMLDLLAPFFRDDVKNAGLFKPLRRQLDSNFAEAGKHPLEFKGTAHELIRAYLHHTPLLSVFFTPIPFEIPPHIRFEHTHIVAASGHGKTQTLQHMIAADLTATDPPAMVIIDSKGDTFRLLERLALFDPNGGALANRLIIIDPTDIKHPPALNLFDINRSRLAGYDDATREQIENGTIELYDYMFGSLLGAELSQKQSLIFRYLARLMLSIPGATIHDLAGVLQDYGAYKHHVDALPMAARTFFEVEFNKPQFKGTKDQILRRLWGVLEQPSFERMFSQPQNRIDMFDALNTGKIVVVHTAKDFLKKDRASLLGRIFIALTLQAALERAPIPAKQRKPTFLYVDEAAEYFDENIDELGTQARSYKLGIVFAHQYLDQLGDRGLKASIATNTSIKLAGGISDKDARALAPDMHTSAEFITRQTNSAHASTFATYVRGLTPTALSLSVPRGTLEDLPRMSDAAHAQLRADNRAQTTATPPTRAQQMPAPPPANVRVGDRVQVTLNGADQFVDGAIITAIHDGFVFVDCSKSGVPLADVRLFGGQRAPPITAGHHERISLPDYGLTLEALLDSGADMSVLEVGHLETLDRNGTPHARFTLAGRGGASITIERPIVHVTSITGVTGVAEHHCPIVVLSIKLAAHQVDEPFALIPGNSSRPVLLGRTFLAGRAHIDSQRTHITSTDDDWQS